MPRSSITPKLLGGLEHGHKAAAGPGDDPGFGAGVVDGLQVGGELGGVQGGEDVIADELAAEEGAGIAGRSGAAVAKAVIGGDLDEGVVLGGEVLTQVDEVLVVLPAGAEGVLVEVDAGDVVGGGGGDDEGHLALGGDLLQGGGAAGADGADQEVDRIDIDELAGQGGGGLGAALVVADQDLDLAVIEHVGVVPGGRGAGGVFHTEHKPALGHRRRRSPARRSDR